MYCLFCLLHITYKTLLSIYFKRKFAKTVKTVFYTMPQTGATRYQKFLKSEKAKTKLKGKKELPKGTNVTKTNFKVKKIVIKEQLKKHGSSEALSARKLNVKELLSRLNHFNTNSRTDALDGLKELITSHSKVLEENLGQVIQGVTPLTLNIEKVVRREAVKVLHLILSNVTAEKVEPFFDIMCTYLRSAMTHIDTRIQEDSLLFLDTLLLCTPKRVAQDFHKIIPNFLDMISKLRVDSKPGRTLTVNLDSQITSVKWRVKVLDRLQDFLQKFVEQHNVSHTDEIKKDINHEFDERKSNVFPLTNPTYTAVCRLSCFSSKNMQDTAHIDEVEKFKEYIETLMPLLFETWVEVCPNANTEKNIETVVGEDAAVLLKHILEVVVLLWELVQYYDRKTPSSMMQNTFCQNYRQPFNQHLVQAFPFVTHSKLRQPKSADSPFENPIKDPKLVVENLEICHLFIMLNPYVNKNQEREMSAVLHYIEKMFIENTNNEVFNIVLKILNTVFLNVVTNWNKNTLIMGHLFRKIILAYFSVDICDAYKQNIFTLLCKMSLENKLPHFVNSEPYQKWFVSIPDILLSSSITRETIEILLKYAIGNNRVFNQIVLNKLHGIINNLPHLVNITSADTVTCFKLLSIVYWIRNFDTKSLDLLENQLLNGEYDVKYQKFLMDSLKLRTLGYY